MSAKILILDIENMANLLWSWQVYSRGGWSAIDTELPWYPLGVGVKWHGQKGRYIGLEDYKGYKPLIKRYKDGGFRIYPPNLKPILQDVWALLDEADIVIGWNSDSFDIKKLNDKFIELGFKPYTPFASVDVMKKKRQLTAGNSNKLDDTGEQWGIGRKTEHNGWPLWMGCAEGDPEALALMRKYCIQDIALTERAYDYLLPWMKTHPSRAVLDENPQSCPRCGVEGKIIRGMKYKATNTNLYQYVHCNACGWRGKNRLAEKTEKPLYT